MGRRQKGQDINGILLLDKPRGKTSNAALQAVKRIIDARKAGHTGSLDPLATGLLPLCFGQATKVSAYLLDADKRYEAEICLGVTTTTGDCEGQITNRCELVGIDENRLRAVLTQFVGNIEQVPPMFSALKQDGQPLYKLARRGLEVERAPRTVQIKSLELRDFDGTSVNVTVHCSKGTYIRTLAEDIGQALGCGGHITALRRISAGPFSIEQAHLLDEITAHVGANNDCQTLLRPVDAALVQLPEIELETDSANFVTQGNRIRLAEKYRLGMVRMYGPRRQFLGIGEITADGCIAPRRIMCGNR